MKEIKIKDLLNRCMEKDDTLPDKIGFRGTEYKKKNLSSNSYIHYDEISTGKSFMESINYFYDLNGSVTILDEVKEMTVDEISEKLGYKVKVVGENR